MKKLTLDQAELVFSLFIAQNSDKKISDLFPSDDEYRQTNIGALEIEKDNVEVWLIDRQHGKIPFRYYSRSGGFKTWDVFGNPWYYFDIFKFITLEDKI